MVRCALNLAVNPVLCNGLEEGGQIYSSYRCFLCTLVIRIIQTNSTYRCYASLASVSGGSVFEQVVREAGDSNCHRICLPTELDSGERIVEWKTQQVGLKEV